MKKIRFEYADALSHWEWKTQECIVESIEECIRIYGLNDGNVDYHILSVEDINNE